MDVSNGSWARELAQGRRVTLWGAAVNVALIALKGVAGVLGASQALVADAVHSVSDLATDVVVLVGIKLGRAPADDSHPFGHGRIETLASVLVGLALIGAAAYLGLDAARSLAAGEPHHPTWLAVAAALVSIASKEAMYRWTMAVGLSIGSNALKANAWHHRSDALSSVAVLIGAGGAAINPSWHYLDPLAALLVSALVAWAGAQVIWAAVQELVESAPDVGMQDQLRTCAMDVSGVKAVHGLRVRSLGGRYHLELHVVVDRDLSVARGHDIAKEVERCLLEAINQVEQVIIHVDPDGERLGT